MDALTAIDVDRIETRQAELAADPGEMLLGAFAMRPGEADADVVRVLDLPALLAPAFGDRRRPVPRAAGDGRREPRRGPWPPNTAC